MMERPVLIGICGGIGSGKSVVSRMLREMGYEVYDCDSEARRLMESSGEIKHRICTEISAEVTDGHSIPDRKLLGEIVFADEAKRQLLNSIVHGAVRADLQLWTASRTGNHAPIFVEAAVLAESGLAELCDAIWQVVTPTAERVARVIERDGCTAADAQRRIASQVREAELLKAHRSSIVEILNDADHSLLRQVTEGLDKLSIV